MGEGEGEGVGVGAGVGAGAVDLQPTCRAPDEDEIERKVRSLLNKICPDNLKTIVERLALIELHKARLSPTMLHL